MKVSKMIEVLQEHNPDEEVMALWWTKPDNGDFADDSVLTDEAWSTICTEFDDWEDAGVEVSEWLVDAVIQYSIDKEEA